MTSAAKRIRCRSRARSYDIRVGAQLLPHIPDWIDGQRGLVLADERLAEAAEQLVAVLRARGWQCALQLLAVSEELKTLAGVAPLYGRLLEAGLDRGGVVFAFGGGALGDAVGFVAGTYLRGVRWVVLASTLLAQVDSAIGGKTAINYVRQEGGARGKNLVGVIHAPSLVVCDLELLQSLPERDIASGLGEIVKYGLGLDARFYRWVAANWRRIYSREPAALAYAVGRCAQLKARVVSRDEYEERGEREVLNLGHTVGHALEAAAKSGALRHGEAVIYGLRAAVRLSAQAGHLHPRTQARIEGLLRELPVPPLPATMEVAQVVARLRWDKKRRGEQLRFILLRAVGQTVADETLDEATVAAVVADLR